MYILYQNKIEKENTIVNKLNIEVDEERKIIKRQKENIINTISDIGIEFEELYTSIDSMLKVNNSNAKESNRYSY